MNAEQHPVLEEINKSNGQSKAEAELEFIERFLIQSGYSVSEGDVFATVVSIVHNYKETMTEHRAKLDHYGDPLSTRSN